MTCSKIGGRRLGDRLSKLSLADKSPSPRPNKLRGKKGRKSKDSAAASTSHGDAVISGTQNKVEEPSLPHQGSKEMEEKLANLRQLRDFYKDSCVYYNPIELRDDPGAEPLESKIPLCSHQGNKNPFTLTFCKPDCPHTDGPCAHLSVDTAPRKMKENSSAHGESVKQKASKQMGRYGRVPRAPFQFDENGFIRSS